MGPPYPIKPCSIQKANALEAGRLLRLAPLTLDVPNDRWEKCGTSEPSARLHVSVFLNGMGLHLDAYQVEEGEADPDHDHGAEYGQRLVEDGDTEVYELWLRAAQPDGAFDTIQITVDGVPLTYVVFASPFC